MEWEIRLHWRGVSSIDEINFSLDNALICREMLIFANRKIMNKLKYNN
jgi:hypothetical protein